MSNRSNHTPYPRIGVFIQGRTDPADYTFCEAINAFTTSGWHLRRLEWRPARTLCGAPAGADFLARVADNDLDSCCRECARLFIQETHS